MKRTDGMTEFACREGILSVYRALSHDFLQGKERAVRLSLVALLSGGHILLEDIPGLGKTTLALALSGVLGLSFGRVQCTSDLLPSDITGLSVYHREENRFTFIKGPVFSNILLVDELNRAMPKTQSALLEAMEERRVTVEGVTYQLPVPFLVIATQNPLEQVGTYPLPESQLDRFLMRTGLGYPPAELERAIIRGGSIREQLKSLRELMTADQILEAQKEVREGVYLSERVSGYIYDIIDATRRHPLIRSGISTRGAIGIADAARANAYLEGRSFVAPEDVQAVVVSAASHRLVVRDDMAAPDKEQLLLSILQNIPLPLV